MAKSFAKAFAVFCLVLGVSYALVKLLAAPPKLMYGAPALALVYLGIEILFMAKHKKKESRR